MDRLSPEPRSAWKHFQAITTQWRDNDRYGHINNAVHYTWFDTTVNAWLIDQGLLDLAQPEVVGLVVSTSCQYFSEAAYPDRVCCGLRAARVGRTSVTYELGLFRNDDPLTFATGRFVHVYVRWPSREPAPLSEAMVAALARIAA
jgi:acyl-CoA thioester hydrolase